MIGEATFKDRNLNRLTVTDSELRFKPWIPGLVMVIPLSQVNTVARLLNTVEVKAMNGDHIVMHMWRPKTAKEVEEAISAARAAL